LDDIENNLKEMGIRGWRKITRNKDGWKLIIKEAKTLFGQ